MKREPKRLYDPNNAERLIYAVVLEMTRCGFWTGLGNVLSVILLLQEGFEIPYNFSFVLQGRWIQSEQFSESVARLVRRHYLSLFLTCPYLEEALIVRSRRQVTRSWLKDPDFRFRVHVMRYVLETLSDHVTGRCLGAWVWAAVALTRYREAREAVRFVRKKSPETPVPQVETMLKTLLHLHQQCYLRGFVNHREFGAFHSLSALD
mgnify:CR=1 FL=1